MIRLENTTRRPTRPATLRGMEFCQPWDSVCIERNQAQGVSNVQSGMIDAADAQRANCESNAEQQPEPWRTEAFAQCAARWPEGMAGNVPFQNLTPAYQAVAFQTPTQAADTFIQQQTAAAALLRKELNAAGQTFIPFAARPENQLGTSTGANSPKITFANTSGASNAQLAAGDYWKITITGGAPNTTVYVTGGKNGDTAKIAAGTTDAAGAFTLTGQTTDAEIGAWNETWSVGSAAAPPITFTVGPKPAPVAPASTTGAAGHTPGAGGVPLVPPTDPLINASNAAPAGILATIESQPWYVLAGGGMAAALAFHAMFGGGRR